MLVASSARILLCDSQKLPNKAYIHKVRWHLISRTFKLQVSFSPFFPKYHYMSITALQATGSVLCKKKHFPSLPQCEVVWLLILIFNSLSSLKTERVFFFSVTTNIYQQYEEEIFSKWLWSIPLSSQKTFVTPGLSCASTHTTVCFKELMALKSINFFEN